MTLADDLASWDAVETVSRVRSREVSALEVVDAALERMTRARALGAVVTATPDRARARAATVTVTGPLAGVPTFIKDLAKLEGVPTGWGSRGGGQVARTSEPIARRIEAAGAVVLGKSATPEFGLTATTEPVGFAPCKNPIDPRFSSGGSSGGAGALVASGVVPLAHGSDGGGSIRVPAAWCGLVGFKPSRKRLDMAGSNLLPVNIAVDGVLTRTVRDTVAFFAALERPGGALAPIGALAGQPMRGLKIGLFVDAPEATPVHPECRDAAVGCGRACEALGHHVEQLSCPVPGQVNADFLHYWEFVAWVQVVTARVMLHHRFDSAKCDPWTTALVRGFGEHRRRCVEATVRLRRFTAQYAQLMKRFDVLLSPTTGEPPPLLGAMMMGPDRGFDDVHAHLRRCIPFTPMHNVAGSPAISLPWGRTGEGLPVGVQLAGAHGADRLVLELATALEASAPQRLLARGGGSGGGTRTTST